MHAQAGDTQAALRRLGYDPLDQTVEISEGRQYIVKPVWKELAALSQPALAPPLESKPQPKAEVTPKSLGPLTEKSKPDREPSATAMETPKTKPANIAMIAEDPGERRYRAALVSVEERATVWDFRGAWAAWRRFASRSRN